MSFVLSSNGTRSPYVQLHPFSKSLSFKCIHTLVDIGLSQDMLMTSRIQFSLVMIVPQEHSRRVMVIGFILMINAVHIKEAYHLLSTFFECVRLLKNDNLWSSTILTQEHITLLRHSVLRFADHRDCAAHEYHDITINRDLGLG